MSGTQVPILLLKTRTQPTDSYAEYFTANQSSNAEPSFEADFIPVLSHARNRQNLSHLEVLLRQGQLKEEYGGIIFTSQRAVEGWSDVVKAVAEGTVRPSYLFAQSLRDSHRSYFRRPA
jgi:uroporphyrinogen-III synthase